MKKMNLNLKEKLTPKKVRILIVATALLLVIAITLVIILCFRKSSYFQPYDRTWGEIRTETSLKLQDDSVENMSYKEPVSVFDKLTDVRISGEE